MIKSTKQNRNKYNFLNLTKRIYETAFTQRPRKRANVSTSDLLFNISPEVLVGAIKQEK